MVEVGMQSYTVIMEFYDDRALETDRLHELIDSTSVGRYWGSRRSTSMP